jgi:hypothetical protein
MCSLAWKLVKFVYLVLVVEVILHQFWVKNFFSWKFNLEYSDPFTKLFMHVSSRNMSPTTRNLQIRVHVYRPRHCCGNWLTFGRFVPMIADREEKINNHGCWGKHAHIPDNDYWGICLFHVVWANFFFGNYSYVVHTEYIFIFFSSTEHCAWAIISPKYCWYGIKHQSISFLGFLHFTCRYVTGEIKKKLIWPFILYDLQELIF